MIDIRTALQANIIPASISTTPLFYETAGKKTAKPYVVFSFEPISTVDESSDNFIVNIDGWDIPANGNTTALETLMKTIDGNGDITNPTGLNQKIINTSTVTLALRRINRFSIVESDTTVKRKRYQYQVTSFERSDG